MRPVVPVLLGVVLVAAAVLALGAGGWFVPSGERPHAGAPAGTAAGASVAASGPTAPSPPAVAAGPGDAGRLPAEPAAIERIHGTVSRPDGSPCAGALVTAECSGLDEYALLDGSARRARSVVATATSDRRGAYELSVPPGRHHLVRASAAGFAPAAQAGCIAGSRVDFTLAFAAVLAGVVRDTAGAAVPGTRIVVRDRTGIGGQAVTDAQGFYRIEALAPGTTNVDVQPAVLAAPRDVHLKLLAGAVTTHDVTLVAGVTIRGHVLDATTRGGIAGAEVGEGVAGRTVRTDASGAFALPGFAAAHNLSIRVAADGYAGVDRHLRGRSSAPADVQTQVEILLVRGYAVRGVVADERGTPLAGVYAAAAAADFRGDHDRFRSDWRSVRTSADGRFRVAALRPDMQHELLLVHAGRASLLLALPERPPGTDELDVGELRLAAGGSLAGVVVDEHGKPVAGQDLELAGHNADRWRLTGEPPAEHYRPLDGYAATRLARSDAAGRFLFADLAGGVYAVRALQPDSHVPHAVAVTLAAGEARTGVRLEVFAGLSLGGRIVMQDGSAAPKCYCSIDPEDGQATSGDVEVGPDGSFRATGLLPGHYKVTVYPYETDADRAAGRSFRPREFEHVVAGTHALRCELPVFGLVRGEVRRADQAPAAGTWVVLHDGERELDATAIGPNGRFVLTAITGGRPLRVHVLPAPPAAGTAPSIAGALLVAEAAPGAPPLVLVLPGR